MYEYRAKVTRVVDGDSFYADVDLGFHIKLNNLYFRLLGVDTPEVRGETKEEGLKVAQLVRDLIDNQTITIRTEKTGSFGRWLADVDINGINLNYWLLHNGYAKKYEA